VYDKWAVTGSGDLSMNGITIQKGTYFVLSFMKLTVDVSN